MLFIVISDAVCESIVEIKTRAVERSLISNRHSRGKGGTVNGQLAASTAPICKFQTEAVHSG